MMHKIRLIDIDIVTALAIILVVFGHMEFESDMNKLYLTTIKVIYSFHMPLFMFFSGFLISYNYKDIKNVNQYIKFVKVKFIKFFPPYIFLSLVYFLVELKLGKLSEDNVRQVFYYIFFIPTQSPAEFLWYIYVLMQIYILFPILKIILDLNKLFLVIISLSIHFIPLPELFNFNQLGFYLIFISLSMIVNEYLYNYNIFVKRYGIIFLILFMIFILSGLNHSKLVCGLLSIPAFHFFAFFLEKTFFKPFLIIIAKNVFSIYLLNSLFMGAIYLFVKNYTHLNLSIMFLFVLFISGISLPILFSFFLVKIQKTLK